MLMCMNLKNILMKPMENKTAVEWLIEMLTEYKYLNKDADHYFEQALEMEKEQIIIAYKSDRYPCSDQDAEDYYNETYKK